MPSLSSSKEKLLREGAASTHGLKWWICLLAPMKLPNLLFALHTLKVLQEHSRTDRGLACCQEETDLCEQMY